MSNEKKNQNQIQIEVPQEEMQGRYANLAVIAHSPNEFVLDFVFLSPGNPKARVQSRIVMTPENAKQLVFALKENMDKYEMNFGEITLKRRRTNDDIIDFTQAKGQA
ncbi:MAG: DUF3467 domain-containing protein [Muribaculaceae bacterium]|nr:DUF3467 domain-containing protein [Muribaculaceae bacterium]